MPIRLTASEGRSLDRRFAAAVAPTKPRKPARVSAPKVLERDITSSCVGYLRAHGWRCIRLQSGLARGRAGSFFNLGELGMPDWIVMSPDKTFFLEMKRPGGQLGSKQIEWHENARRNGFQVCVADSSDALTAWMRENLSK